MTYEEILAMKPGRELDALVAEKVMGWKTQFMGEGSWGWMYTEPDRNLWNNVPHFSTDISAAWEVVEKMQENKNISFSIRRKPEWDMKWVCHFWDENWETVRIVSDTAPEAICKAALLACLEGK